MISDEKELNSLDKCDKFFGGFNAKHDLFESLLEYIFSLIEEYNLKLFIVKNGYKSLPQLQQCHVVFENVMCWEST